MKKNYIRLGYLFFAFPFLMISTGTILGIIDDCSGMDFISIIQVIFEDIILLLFSIFLGLIGIILLCIFIRSIKVKPEFAELKLKKMQVDSPILILVFEDQFVNEILYYTNEEEKDKYQVGKYYKVMKTKDKIYEVLD